jgi:hypothetical protein
MHAHLVVDEVSPVVESSIEQPTQDAQLEPKSKPESDPKLPVELAVEVPLPSIVSIVSETSTHAPMVSGTFIPTPIVSVAFTSDTVESRIRTKSLSASVSSSLDQARAAEKKNKAARVKGGSSIKGSPAWRAERRLLDVVSPSSSTFALASASGSDIGTPNELPSIPAAVPASRAGSRSGLTSKGGSWFGGALMGSGLAITPSSSSPTSVISRNAGAGTGTGGGHSATPSLNGSTGFNTPPAMRVSFAKEPVKYSEERERDDGLISDAEEEEEEEETTAAADGNGDGALTIKARSLRRVISWNDSISGSTRKRVPLKNNSKNKDKKRGGWLEWFVNATGVNANPTPGGGVGFGGTPGVGVIGREEVYESRIGREDWT